PGRGAERMIPAAGTGPAGEVRLIRSDEPGGHRRARRGQECPWRTRHTPWVFPGSARRMIPAHDQEETSMANPYFTSNANFGKSTPNYPVGEAPYAQQQVGQVSTAGYDRQFAQVQQSYYGPDASSRQTGSMTIDDVVIKSAFVIGAVVVAAIASWQLVPASIAMPVLWVGLIAGLVLGLVNAFKKQPSPALIVGYAVAERIFLGLISRVFAAQWEGI